MKNLIFAFIYAISGAAAMKGHFEIAYGLASMTLVLVLIDDIRSN